MRRRRPFRSAWIETLAGLGALLAALAWAPTAQAQQQVEEREMELLVGEQTTLPAQGVESFSEGKRGIVDIRVAPDGSQFIIVANQVGNTSLLLIRQDGRQIKYAISVVEEATDEKPGVVAQDNIRLDFYFVQLSESYAHQVGVGWPASFGGGADADAVFDASIDLLEPQVLNATAVISSQPLPRVDLLQSQGWARLLRQVALITVSGNEASFRSGGEVNVLTSGLSTGGLAQVEFGSTVRVQPRYDTDTGRIELRINAEVSTLSDDRGTGVPGRDISKLQTLVNLEMGQAVALAGLISDEKQSSQAGLPGLSQIPIIGALFGSNSLSEAATQNILFIVPSVVDVVSQNARERISDAMDVYWKFSGGLLYNADLEAVELLPMPDNTPSAAEPGARPLGEEGDEDEN